MFPSVSKDDNIQNLKNSGHEMKEDVKGIANQASRKVRNFYDSATDNISQASDTVSSQIRSTPIQSSLLALAAGFVLGALFKR